MYIGFLLSEPHATSCVRLQSLLPISHDSVNRFLSRESSAPKDMFYEAKLTLNLIALYYTDPQGNHQLVNFHVYDQSENKTKMIIFKKYLLKF